MPYMQQAAKAVVYWFPAFRVGDLGQAKPGARLTLGSLPLRNVISEIRELTHVVFNLF